MTELYFATGNRMKFDEAEEFFKKYMPHITLKQCDKDFDEIQSLDPEAIALNKAHQAWDYLKKPVIVDDAGIYFHQYHNFPGTLTKFIFKGLGYEGIFRLVNHNNPASFKLVLVFMYGPDKYQTFEAHGDGKIIHTHKLERTYEGGPFDPLFVPDGQTKTYDELRHEGNFEQYNYRVQGLKKLGAWLETSTI
jgi:non-canonical purine NTP pyrophosphatase (RdgB/HAM1 family)